MAGPSSGGSDLAELYNKTVEHLEDLLDRLVEIPNHNSDGSAYINATDVEAMLDNATGSIISWHASLGSDLNPLSSVDNTAIGCKVARTLETIYDLADEAMSQLEGEELPATSDGEPDLNRLNHFGTVASEIKDATSVLHRLVRTIQMAQAVRSGTGPAVGLMKAIQDLQSTFRPDGMDGSQLDVPVEAGPETQGVEPLRKTMPTEDYDTDGTDLDPFECQTITSTGVDTILPGFQHPLPKILSVRRIPQSVWEAHKNEVTWLYIHERLPLTDLMGKMSREHGFVASAPQWKRQMKRWGVHRNIHAEEMAWMLKLYQKASAEGVIRHVFYHGRELSTTRLSRHINRSRYSQQQLLLLNMTFDPSDIPRCISFMDDTKESNRTGGYQDLQRSHNESKYHTPETTTDTGMTPSLAEDTDDVRSFTSLVDTGEDPNLEAENLAIGHDALTLSKLDSLARQTLAPKSTKPYQLRNTNLYPFLSATPVAVDFSENRLVEQDEQPEGYKTRVKEWLSTTSNPEVGIAPTTDQSLSSSHDEVLSTKELASDPTNNSTDPDNTMFASRFLSCAFQTCIMKGQAHDTVDVDSCLRDCLGEFNLMLQHHGDQVLFVLHTLVVILEAHGQKEFSSWILERASEESSRTLGGDHPLSRFAEILWRCGRPEWLKFVEFDTLIDIVVQLAQLFGSHSGSALTAKYIVGWTLMSHEDYENALQVLSNVQTECGSQHLMLVCSCLLTGSRAYFSLGRWAEAETTMAAAIDKLTTCYPGYHPLILEARYRLGVYLYEAGNLVGGEKLWRHVLIHQFRILGPQNPRTSEVFGRLLKFLSQAGRQEDAARLFEQISSESGKIGEVEKWSSF